MNSILKKPLLAMSLLVIANGASAKLPLKNSLGVNLLAVNKDLQKIPDTSKVTPNVSGEKAKINQAEYLNNIKKIKENIQDIKAGDLFIEILKSTNSEKINVSTKKFGIVSFNDYRDTVRSALLLERVANEVKNDQIKSVDAEKFDKIMNNLSDDKRKIASLIFE